MNQLRKFFESEKKRIFEPDAFFSERVMARLTEGSAWEYGIWEIIPNSARPVLAMALALILCFVLAELWIPQMPQSGVVESFLVHPHSAESHIHVGKQRVAGRQVLFG